MHQLSPGGLLFDLDGVLADSTAAVQRHWRAFAERRGLVPEDVLDIAHGRRSTEVIADLVSAGEAAEEAAWFEALEVADTSDVVALPGAAELLEKLPAHVWTVVTSCGRDLAAARLAASGLPSPIALISGDDVTRGKPDPQGYLLGLAALRVEATKVVVFEDAPAGVAAGRAAGATVVGLTTTHAGHQLDASHLVGDLRSVELLLGPGGAPMLRLH